MPASSSGCCTIKAEWAKEFPPTMVLIHKMHHLGLHQGTMHECRKIMHIFKSFVGKEVLT